MSIADEKPRRRRMPVFGERRKASREAEAAPDPADDGAAETPTVVSTRMQAMLSAAPEAEPEGEPEAILGNDDPPEAAEVGPAIAPGAERPHRTAEQGNSAESSARAAPLRAMRDIRPAVSEPAPPETCAPAGAPSDDADPEAPGNRAISLAIRLGSMMGVVLAGVFAATLVDLALGLQTRFQGLGILATYLVVLAVILTPSLNPRTRRQWIVVIVGFAGVIMAIALGSAVARLMLQTKDFQHTGLYVHLAVEFGVMFAFWGLASLAFVEILRRVGINIGSDPGDEGTL
jgi:hypothetical protein